MSQQTQSKGKISTRAALLLGLMIGLAATAAVYSVANTLAQTNTTTPTTPANPYFHGDRPFSPRWGDYYGNSTFTSISFHAISEVQNVTITGFNVASSSQITLNLKYTGSGTSPAITIVAMSPGLTGSTVEQAGWGSPATVTVNLVGSGSLTANSCYRILIVPYTG